MSDIELTRSGTMAATTSALDAIHTAEPLDMDPSKDPRDTEIRVLTLNCWGLKYVSKDRIKRTRAIGDEIAASNYDIVGLQELWVRSDYDYIKSRVDHKLPYSRYFLSGALGAGLVIFSRFPIISTSLHPYSLCGSPLDVGGGDWFVGKAVVSAVIEHPLLGEVEIFNTHLYAKGGESPSQPQMAHRLVNTYEFSRRVNISTSLGRHVLAVGDFNTVSRSPAMQFIYAMTGLRDAWGSTHGSFVLPQADGVHSPHHAVADQGVTADSPLNSYSKGKVFDDHARKWLGKRLDYILFRPPHSSPSHSRPYDHELRCRDSTVTFTHQVPGTDISFSDHFGVAATFDVVPCATQNGHNGHRPITPPHGTSYSPTTRGEVLDHAIKTMGVAYAAARRDSHQQLLYFVGLLALLIALMIASAWNTERGVNPLLVFLSAVITWGGTTLLYAGFLGGGWETRALMRVTEELELLLEAEQRRGY
ncbi:phospholipase C type enzyme [Ceratobasidium sp. 428]|nr:phospholipase C type enzyme [Ceratobasidium sp. 428]